MEKVTTSEILKQEGMRELEKPAKYVCIVDGEIYFFSKEDIENLKPQEIADLVLKLRQEKNKVQQDNRGNRIRERVNVIYVLCAVSLLMSVFSILMR